MHIGLLVLLIAEFRKQKLKVQGRRNFSACRVHFCPFLRNSRPGGGEVGCKSKFCRAAGGLTSFLRRGVAPPQEIDGGHLPPLPPWLRRPCQGIWYIESDQLIMKLGLVLFKKLGKARIR